MYDPAARHNSPVAKFTGELPDTEPKWVWVDGGKPEKARHGRCDGQRLHNLWMGRAICLHPEPGDRDPYWAAERVCSLPRSCDRASGLDSPDDAVPRRGSPPPVQGRRWRGEQAHMVQP